MRRLFYQMLSLKLSELPYSFQLIALTRALRRDIFRDAVFL